MKLERPLLVWDGDCTFCRAWVARWKRAIGDAIDVAPYQDVAARFPDIPVERFRRAVQLIEPDGTRTEAAEGVFRSLALAPGHGPWRWLYERLPGFASLSEWLYRVVADHRPLFTRLTSWIWGRHVVPPGETVTSWLFLRILGAIFLAAFLSLRPQLAGLVGHDGILPARELLGDVGSRYGAIRFWFMPTLAWIDPSDAFLAGLCLGGAALSALLMLGVAPFVTLAGAWIAYLALATVCRDFLWFQWDSLLLETGFAALLLAPLAWWSRPRGDPPSRVALALLRWLLFRLMISSAIVKLTSGDPAWRGLTALQYHYETQPLPPWTAWYAHHLPVAIQRFSAASMFVIEGLVPFAALGPRRIRFTAAALMVGLQTLIAATGNYGFFNPLAIALCVLLLDDGVWPGGVPAATAPAPRGARLPGWLVRTVAITLVGLSLVPLANALRRPAPWLDPVGAVYRFVSPFRVVNGYGLFAVMTTVRREIVIDGSADGATWQPYEFRWKPGDLRHKPAFVAPHMPRLDWQMWFAALSDVRREAWFVRFMERLLQGARPVTGMLARDPFAASRPRFVRARILEYHFTDAATRRATGAWWTAKPLGIWCPSLTLVDGHIALADSTWTPSQP